MKFVEPSHFTDPDAAARKLAEIANATEAVQDGRIYIELINRAFLEAGGTPDQYRAALARAITLGWLSRHESGRVSFAGLARLVARQPFDALRHEPGLPSPHHGLGFARAAHDLGGATAVGCGKNDVGPPHMLLSRAAIRDDRLKPMAVRQGDLYDYSCSHAESLNRFG
jgi:hypothetical protein